MILYSRSRSDQSIVCGELTGALWPSKYLLIKVQLLLAHLLFFLQIPCFAKMTIVVLFFYGGCVFTCTQSMSWTQYFLWYSMRYDMIWCMIWYDVWYATMYDMIYNVTYDTIWYMIWYLICIYIVDLWRNCDSQKWWGGICGEGGKWCCILSG